MEEDLCPWRCVGCGHVNAAWHRQCRGKPKGSASTGATSSAAAAVGTGGPGADMAEAQVCGHLRSIAGVAGAEYQGNDWVCGRCWLEVQGTDEKPPRMWPKVPMCRRCRRLRADVEASHGVMLVRDLPEGTLFAS